MQLKASILLIFLATNTARLCFDHAFRSPKQKKLKTDIRKSQIIASKSVTGFNAIIESFHMAVKCWELLHSTESSSKGM